MQRVESCGDLLHNMEIEPEFEEPKFAYTREHQPPFALGMLNDAASKFENRNMCCKVCKARIPTEVTSEPTFCDTENGTKFKIHTQVHNQQPVHFPTAETNRLNGLASSVPESLMSIKKNEVTGKKDLDLLWKDIRVLVNALNRLSSALPKSEPSHELAAGTRGEAEGSEYLCKEASDAIRRVESCLVGLQTGPKLLEQDGSKEALMENIIQEELSDVMNNFLPNTASANFSVNGNTPLTTGIGLYKKEISASGESLQHALNGRYKKASPLHQAPSRTISRPMEMRFLYSKDNHPTNSLQSTNTRMNSQPIGGTTFLASRPYMQNQMGSPYKEKKVEDWMLPNKAESNVEGIRPLYEAPNQIYQMPRWKLVSNQLLPCREEMLQRLPDSSSWLPCHTHDRSPKAQLEYESILEDKFNKSRASKLPMNLRHLKEYKNHNRLESESDSNVCRTWMVHNKDGFPSRMLKQQTLIDKQPSDISRPFTCNSKWKHDDAVGHRRINDCKHQRRKLVHQKHEVDNAYTNSSSSSWRNQGSYPSSSYTEKFNTSGHSRRRKSASTRSSESGIYSPLPSRPSQYTFVSNSGEERSSYTSNEDYELTSSTPSYTSEEYSSPSSSTDQVSISGDSDDYGLSSHGKIRQLQHHKDAKYLSMDSASDASNSTRNQRKATLKQPKKQGGAWKKLKDKFSIIFHHHHHHHHHHHRVGEDDDRDRSNRDSRIKHGKYLAKQNGKKEAGKHAVDKVGKSIINAEARKDEQKHLGRLVTGLFSHIKHKKKSKTFASKSKRLGKGKHEGKNMWKKKHWWQMLHRHKQVKRLGFGHKN